MSDATLLPFEGSRWARVLAQRILNGQLRCRSLSQDPSTIKNGHWVKRAAGGFQPTWSLPAGKGVDYGDFASRNLRKVIVADPSRLVLMGSGTAVLIQPSVARFGRHLRTPSDVGRCPANAPVDLPQKRVVSSVPERNQRAVPLESESDDRFERRREHQPR